MYTRQNKINTLSEQSSATMGPSAFMLNDNRPRSVQQKKGKGPTNAPVVQRVELNLSNKGEPWTVDSKETTSLKSWIEHQQEVDNFQGIRSLANQLQNIPEPTKGEQFIYHYAQLKAAEVHAEVNKKIARVRRDANPMNITSIPRFVKAQAQYQNIMNGYYSKAQIMKNHQSIGLEFEFANYANDIEVPSHIDLSQTGPYSALFNLPFVLETDSGKELEIGFPPFLVYIDGHEKSKIKDIWLVMRKEMSKIREACKGRDLNYLLQQIARSGLGTGWSAISSKYNGMRVATERTKHVSVKKDSVYSQLNISMPGKESAEYLKKIATTGGLSTQAERELIQPVHAKVAQILDVELAKKEIVDMTEEVFIHLAKSSTSIMAIPSVIIQDNPLLQQAGMTHGLFDLQSTVKELHGIWVKDSLPNILRTINPKSLKAAAALLERAKDQLIDYATKEIRVRLHASFDAGLKTTDGYFKEHLQAVREALEVPLASANDWFGSEDWAAHGRLQAELGTAITAMAQLVEQDKTGFLTGFGQGLQTLRDLQRDMPLYRPDTTGAGAHYNQGGYTYLTGANWTQPQQHITDLQRVFNTVRDFNPKSELEALFVRIITDEIDGTIKILKESSDFVKTPKTKFNQGEQFGTGHGVRKDTHIPTIQIGKNLGKNVAELRGDEIMEQYLDH